MLGGFPHLVWTDRQAVLKSLDNFVFGELRQRVPKLRNIKERSDAMLACYPGEGSRFQKHVDNTAHDGRKLTVLLYLNSPPDGGWTAFPRADTPEPLLVQPVKGTAVLFYNMLPDGNADVYSLHAALPTRTGEKWLANLWVWDAPRL